MDKLKRSIFLAAVAGLAASPRPVADELGEAETPWYLAAALGMAVIAAAYAFLCVLATMFPRGRRLLDRKARPPRPPKGM